MCCSLQALLLPFVQRLACHLPAAVQAVENGALAKE